MGFSISKYHWTLSIWFLVIFENSIDPLRNGFKNENITRILALELNKRDLLLTIQDKRRQVS